MSHLAEVKKHYGTLKNYIGGKWVDSTSGNLQQVVNPATGEEIALVPMSTKDDVDAACAFAAQAWWSWRSTPPVQRARVMFKIKEILEAHFEEISRIITQECGKTIEEARGDARRAIENIEVAAGITSLQMGYSLEDGAAAGIDEEAICQPLGVFACIAPFNFPAMVPFWFWPYAIATGNTYIVKPSELVPCTMQYIFELIQDAGLPAGVLNLVNGGAEVGNALIEHPDIKGVSFVGSTPVAKHVYKTCAAYGKRVQAQGGAKNCMVVMKDAVIPRAVSNILASCFGCAGQRCLAGSNVLVEEEIYDEFKEQFVAGARSIKLGYGLDETVGMGPVISAKARERILGYIEKGILDGGRLLLDGRSAAAEGYPGGFFVGPTIFEGVSPTSTIAREEIFGPVASLMKIKDLEEAIAIIHSSRYGNEASIYTQSGKTAREFKYRVQAGNIGINIGIAAPMAYFPFAGRKDSFFGDLHGQGRDAINFFTDRKIVVTRWF